MKKVIFITGESGEGKTTLALMLHKHFKSTTEIIRLDSYVKTFYAKKEKITAKHGPIDGTEAWGKYSKEITEELKKNLPKIIESKPAQTWIIEGAYASVGDIAKDLYPTIHITLIGRGGKGKNCLPKQIIINNKKIKVDLKIAHGNQRGNHKGLKENINKVDTQTSINGLLKSAPELRGFLEHPNIEEAKRIAGSLKYQSFEEFGNSAASRSSEKFKLIKDIFNPVNLKGSAAVLDVGCNAGYFCFNICKINKNVACMGIDISKEINKAIKLNKCYFNFPLLKFRKLDFFDLPSKPLKKAEDVEIADDNLPSIIGYDYIICFSAFHYFKEKQVEFLQKSKKILRKGGRLLIEIGVSKMSDRLGHVERYSRGVDKSPTFFPNEITFENWARRLGFSIACKKLSVNQAGDKNPRIFYDLRA
jgi:SAM-dependent methyltransferase